MGSQAAPGLPLSFQPGVPDLHMANADTPPAPNSFHLLKTYYFISNNILKYTGQKTECNPAIITLALLCHRAGAASAWGDHCVHSVMEKVTRLVGGV